jgi:hypothetical protein
MDGMGDDNHRAVGMPWVVGLVGLALALTGCPDGEVGAGTTRDTVADRQEDTAETPPEDTASDDPDEDVGSDSGSPDDPSDTSTDGGGPDPDTTGEPDTGEAPDTGGGPPQVLRFVVMGDTGEGDADQKRVADGARKRCERAGGCHGFLMLGDNIYDTGPDSPQDPQFLNKVDKPYRDLKYGAPPPSGQPDNRKRLPIYASLGNHDLGGAGLNSSLIQHYVDYAKNKSWFHYPSEWWEKQIGNVHLIAIHTNPLAYTGTKEEPQAKLVRQALGKTTADWTIVFGHHPYRSNGQHGNAGSYEGVPGDLTPLGGEYREWVNENVCGKVDFLLTGHDHNRQWLEEMPKLTGDLIGGGSSDPCKTRMAVSGAGAKTRSMEDRDNDLAFGKPSLGFLFMEFDQTTRRVDIEYVDADGNTEWTKTITK